MDEDNTRTVSTINGFVPLSKLKTILPHEHIMHCPLPDKYAITKPKIHPFLDNNDILMNRGHIKMHPYTTLIGNNLSVMKRKIIEELKQCKNCNINTIVENTSYGLTRDIFELKNISQHSKINIIVGTGFYGANVQEKNILSFSKEKMYNIMKKDLTENCLKPLTGKFSNQLKQTIKPTDKVLAGFIGAVGISSPIHEFEKRSISATGEVQSELQCPVSFSPSMGFCDYDEVLRIYQEAGGKSTKAVVTHLDCMLTKKKDFRKFVNDTNCYVQLSTFGDEWSFNHRDDYYDMLSDAQRIKRLKLLKSEEKLHRVLISSDIHTENRLVFFGGHGYSYIFDTIKSHMCFRGLSTNDFEVITYKNPRDWLFWNQQSKI